MFTMTIFFSPDPNNNNAIKYKNIYRTRLDARPLSSTQHFTNMRTRTGYYGSSQYLNYEKLCRGESTEVDIIAH